MEANQKQQDPQASEPEVLKETENKKMPLDTPEPSTSQPIPEDEPLSEAEIRMLQRVDNIINKLLSVRG